MVDPSDIEGLRKPLLKRGFRFSNEKELQDELEKRWQAILGADLQREFILSPKDRPDFFWASKGIAIEVKDRAGRSLVFRQLERYAQHEAVKALVLVVPRIEKLPPVINNKPLSVIELWPLMV